MTSNGPTFWLLDRRNRWGADLVPAGQTGPTPVGLDAGPDWLLLAADPASPLGLLGPDDSLGALVLPRRFALAADGTLYLLGPLHDPWLKRFDRPGHTFVTLAGIGGEGTALRQFHRPRNIAIAGRRLYVADTGNRRVQVFTLPGLALRHVWEQRHPGWRPIDVAVSGKFAYILERRRRREIRVCEYRAGAERLRRVPIPENVARVKWGRIAVDRVGRIYLVARHPPYLAIFDRDGKVQQPVQETVGHVPPDPGPYRDRFDAPPFRLDARGRFCLPESLLGPCGCARPPGVDLERPLSRCPPWSATGMVFDSLGNAVKVDPATAAGPPLYLTRGTWTSGPLDSRIHRCQWHRVELDVARLPVGTRLEVYTFSGPQPVLPDAVRDCQEPDGCARVWDLCYRAAGATPSRRTRPPRAVGPCPHPAIPERRPAAAEDPDRGGPHEFLVQSREGRYLWMRVKLFGDGYATPAVRSITVHYPRASYLDYLPGVYRAEDDSRRFLEQFLSVFQTTWDDLNCEISNIARYFDPKGVPAGAPLTYLAAWLALPLEGAWTDEQRRRLLEAAPKLTAGRGTIAVLRGFLRACLANIAGEAVEKIPDFPALVEGFRDRRRLTLRAPGQDQVGWVEDPEAPAGGGPAARRVGHGTPLWSESVVGRLRLGTFGREGEARLVSTGLPGLDLYQQHADRFRVIVPAAWIPNADAERMFRRAVEAEKPAHTRYDLCLIEPRFRIGVQSTVGHDTILGERTGLRLGDPDDQDTPPSRPPQHRLGYDTVLSGAPSAGPDLELDSGQRLGIDTVIS
jgi:phage tail-like protein